MAYRNGTYIAFHAGGTTDPTASDIKYYNMIKAWHSNDKMEFKFINSHEKSSAVRDSSQRATLKRSLQERLNNSCNMVLIVSSNTKNDTDWVPFEIQHAIDTCNLPIIAAYPGYNKITDPKALRSLWPAALAARIDDGTARVIHIPFEQAFIDDAIGQYTVNNLPPNGLWYYSLEAHKTLGSA